MDRRFFLKSSGIALAGFGVWPSFLARALAGERKSAGKVLVLVFMRGAADGLALVPPLGDPHYPALRPNLALAAQGPAPALKLDGYFGLHPALSALQPRWDEGSLAVVHQVGSPDPSRSHFDAQDYMELGTPGSKAEDGFLNRALQGDVACGDPFRAVALQPALPRSLVGAFPAVALTALDDFQVRDPRSGPLGGSGGVGFESMYRAALDQTLRGVGQEAFSAIQQLTDGGLTSSGGRGPAERNKSPLGRRLHDIASLIRANVGLEIAVTDCGGWDTHVAQGAAEGQLANRLRDLAESLERFAQELGPRYADVCLVTLTEFGRTVRENGSRGTDHGHGSVALVLGGPVKGRRVAARWKDLEEANLFDEEIVPVTTDFRSLMSELLQGHLGITDLGTVFPGFKEERAQRPGVLRV